MTTLSTLAGSCLAIALAKASFKELKTKIDDLVIVISNCSLDSSLTSILPLSPNKTLISKSQAFDFPKNQLKNQIHP